MAVDSRIVGNWFRRQLARGNEGLQFVMRQTRIMTLLLKHPGVPWTSKLIAGCAVGYIFSPVQLIPTFIPVIGQLDDLSVLYIGMKLVRRLTPTAVLLECESQVASRLFSDAPRPAPSTKYGPEAAL